MFRSLFTRRGGVAIAAAAVGVASLSLAFAGTAGAAPYPDNQGAAQALIGSGSQTTYTAMQQLDNLFNSSPGCDETASTSDAGLTSGPGEGTINCGTTPIAPGTIGGEQGFNQSADNPYNDYAVEAPPVGSGTGAALLENAGTGSPTQPISYGRASALKGNTTVNDVEWGTDGVSWTTFAKFNNVATNQEKVVNITEQDLGEIWNGTLGCPGAQFGGMDWYCLGAAKHSPIDVYLAQYGSGTYSTWQSNLNFPSKAVPGGISCATCEGGWVSNGGSPSTIQTAHYNLFENQMATIAGEPDAKDAIYFMSYAKFKTTCPGKAGKAVCEGTSKTTYTTFGKINGVAASQSSIQGTGGGAGVSFPITRGLYNLYNNSSAAAPSNQATLNFISEDGFLCKASTATEDDPITGIPYRTEIENIITANGFYPLDVSGTPFADGAATLNNAASFTDPNFTADDVTGNTGATNSGFCSVVVG